MAKTTKTASVRAAAAPSMDYDTAKAFVKETDAANRKVKLEQLRARAEAIAASPTTRKVGIAALGAGVGALAYHVLAS